MPWTHLTLQEKQNNITYTCRFVIYIDRSLCRGIKILENTNNQMNHIKRPDKAGCSYKSKWQNLQKANRRLKKKVTSLKDSIKELEIIVSEPTLGAYVVVQIFPG